MSAIIGALRAELSASIAEFAGDLGKAADAVKGFSRTCEGISKGLEKIGTRMSVAITAPLVLLAKQSVDAAKESSQALAQVEAALESTGGRSGKTAQELQKSAKALETLSLFDDDNILKEVSANLLRFGNISGEAFDRAQQAAVNLAARLGMDLSSAATVVGKALDQPVVGLQALQKLGVRFTEDQKKQISGMVAAGRGYEAQAVILKQLEVRFEGAAKAARDASPDGALLQSWREFQETIGAVILEVAKPLIERLTAITQAFNDLTPSVKTSVVQFAAAAAVIGPALILFSQLVTAVRVLTVAIAFLTTTTSGLLVLIGLVVAGIAIYNALSNKVKNSVEEQAEAHKTLNDMLDKAHKNGEKINKTDADMAKQKLVLARATLKAAEAQAEHNVEVARFNEMGMKDADSGWAAIGTPDAASARRDLQRVRDGLKQNAADMKRLEDELRAPAPKPQPKPQFKPEFDDGPGADAARKAAAQRLEALGDAAARDVIQVRRLATVGLDPLSKALEDVDTRFDATRESISAHLDDLQKLGLESAAARSTFDELRGALDALDKAHLRARDAAVAQYNAEKSLADSKAQAEGARTQREMRDLLIASGRQRAPLSTMEQNLQRTQDALFDSQAEAALKLKELETQRAEAATNNDVDGMARLDTLIGLQRQYYDLVSKTSAEQIQAAETIADAWRKFTDGLAGMIDELIVEARFDFSTLRSLLGQIVKDLIHPASESAAGFISSGIKSLFSGGFAEGGFIPAGRWGMVGENGPEPAFGGRHGLSITPNMGGGGGAGDTYYIDARGADDAAVRRLGGIVADLQRGEKSRVKSFNADTSRRTRRPYGA